MDRNILRKPPNTKRHLIMPIPNTVPNYGLDSHTRDVAYLRTMLAQPRKIKREAAKKTPQYLFESTLNNESVKSTATCITEAVEQTLRVKCTPEMLLEDYLSSRSLSLHEKAQREISIEDELTEIAELQCRNLVQNERERFSYLVNEEREFRKKLLHQYHNMQRRRNFLLYQQFPDEEKAYRMTIGEITSELESVQCTVAAQEQVNAETRAKLSAKNIEADESRSRFQSTVSRQLKSFVKLEEDTRREMESIEIECFNYLQSAASNCMELLRELEIPVKGKFKSPLLLQARSELRSVAAERVKLETMAECLKQRAQSKGESQPEFKEQKKAQAEMTAAGATN